MIVLLGGGGYLGSILAAYFVSKGENVLTVSRSFQWTQIKKEQRVISQIGNFSNFNALIEKDSTIIYMAGSTDLVKAEENPADDFLTHTDDIKALFECMSSAQFTLRRFIFMSSAGAIYGDSHGIFKSENSFLSPKSIYGKRNLMLESIVADYCKINNIEYSCFRVSNPYGATQHLFRRKGLIQSLILSSITGQLIQLRGSGWQCRDYFFADDFCHSTGKLLDLCALPRCINICSGVSMTSHGVVPNIEVLDEQPDFEVKDSLLDNSLLLSLIKHQENRFSVLGSVLPALIEEHFSL